jgi:hypothetical protein
MEKAFTYSNASTAATRSYEGRNATSLDLNHSTPNHPNRRNQYYMTSAPMGPASPPMLVSHSRSTSDTSISTSTSTSAGSRPRAASARARKYSAKQAALLARPPCPPPSYPIPDIPMARTLEDIPNVRESGIYFGADFVADEPTLYCITPQAHAARSFAHK